MSPDLDKIPSSLEHYALSAGRAYPLGATFDGEGVNFAIFSAHAEKVELCLFSADGRREIGRIQLRERDGDIWYVYVHGLAPGAQYGYRVHGPYVPEQGHRFNPNKLLLDPYAKKLSGALKWTDALMGYKVGSSQSDLSYDTRDNAFAMPKAVVVDPSFEWGSDMPPRTRMQDTIIYEAHVKGLTREREDIESARRGKYLGLASEPMLEYLTKLGITAIELLPIHAFMDDRFLVNEGLRNYWGYQTMSFFAPEPRYMSYGEIWEFQAMVRRFHSAGIEVILDVVYNHTAEGSELGPTLSFRGIDNASYYRLADNPRYYINDTGTGNTMNMTHPMVLRMVMDSLRYWVEVMHVDGFRFDLATVLAREPHGFDVNGGFLDAIRQDSVLNQVKLIAEPWDIGPGGYQLGSWPHPFNEWNDKYRDGVRRFWRGDEGLTADLAKRILGSAHAFDHSGRAATASINFITSHDGFTLHDLVSYNQKHNWANNEKNQDGHNANYSDNMGVEGPTDDPDIIAARNQRKRNMIATLFLSQGTPMMLAGDELGNTQKGNNNAYAQDNPIGWINWQDIDEEFLTFVQKMIRIRKLHSVLRQKLFLHSRQRLKDGLTDLFWRLPNGDSPSPEDWHSADWKTLCVEMRTSYGTPAYAASDDAVFIVFNAGKECEVVLPECPDRKQWKHILDTYNPDAPLQIQGSQTLIAPAASVQVLTHVDDQQGTTF